MRGATDDHDGTLQWVPVAVNVGVGRPNPTGARSTVARFGRDYWLLLGARTMGGCGKVRSRAAMMVGPTWLPLQIIIFTYDLVGAGGYTCATVIFYLLLQSNILVVLFVHPN